MHLSCKVNRRTTTMVGDRCICFVRQQDIHQCFVVFETSTVELWSHLSCFGHLQMYQAWSLMPPQPPPTLLWHRPCQQTFWVHVPPRTGRFLDCGPRQKDCTPIEATTARLPTDLFRKRHATAYTFWCCRVHSMRRWNTRQCGEVHTLRWPCC